MPSRLREFAENLYFRLERLISPSTRFSQHWYERALAADVEEGAAWLDVGCGHQLLPEWRAEAELELAARPRLLVGIDPDLESLHGHRSIRHRVCATLSQLPFPSATFDLVTANMVVEHLEEPGIQFSEIRRVLKPGGLFLFHTPNARSYPTAISQLLPLWVRRPLIRLLEGRKEEDVFPTVYRANTADRLQALADSCGFVNEGIRFNTSSAAFLVILPLAALELVWIRILERPSFSRWRQTIIGRYRRPAAADTL